MIVIARDDDVTFGILHGRFHEPWSIRLGTSLEDRPRYTPTTTFGTCPFPDGLSPHIPAAEYADEPRAVAIAEPARRVVELRDRWLNPPEWVAWVEEPVPGYPKRPAARDEAAAKELKFRTLTNLCNSRPQWLADAHAVFDLKGGRVHVRAGRIFTYCAYVVTLSAVTASAGRLVSFQVLDIGFAEQPDLYGFQLFFGYLGMVTFVLVRHGMRVVATRRAPETLRTPVHEAVGWVSIAGSVAVIAFALGVWSDISPILLALSPIGLFTGSSMLRLMRNPGGGSAWAGSTPTCSRCSAPASPSAARSSSSAHRACGLTSWRGRSP